jgi:hypothetical protein
LWLASRFLVYFFAFSLSLITVSSIDKPFSIIIYKSKPFFQEAKIHQPIQKRIVFYLSIYLSEQDQDLLKLYVKEYMSVLKVSNTEFFGMIVAKH